MLYRKKGFYHGNGILEEGLRVEKGGLEMERARMDEGWPGNLNQIPSILRASVSLMS